MRGFEEENSQRDEDSEPPTFVSELTCIADRGEKYRGNFSTTWSGKTCQKWSAQMPYRHDFTPENYPCGGLEENYCRNPNNEMKPWCFTTDPKTPWEFCNVPICEDSGRTEENSFSFLGLREMV
uniref:Kringle domain-containing protein n=1 Tax=Kryptolebias marmoratus TaxID=37003 RepID=A0A3Q2ZJN8_KRYMA